MNLDRNYVLAFVLLISGCASSIQPHSEPLSYADPLPLQAKTWEKLLGNLPVDDGSSSWFSVLNIGHEGLLQRLALIDTAEASIDAQYFLWLEDGVGSLLFERLLLAADRGVRVRLLLDDSFLAGEDSAVLAFEHHPNIQVRIYNPFTKRAKSIGKRYVENILDFSRINHRMHNKLLIGDGTSAVVGGRNIADEYFGFGDSINFRDFDLLTAGPIVPELADAFDVFWNSGWAFPVPEVEHEYSSDTELIKLKYDLRAKAAKPDSWQDKSNTLNRDWSDKWAKLAREMIPGQAILLYDKPHFEQKPPTKVAEQILAMFQAADTDILAVSAYLVMTDELLSSTQMLADKGIEVSYLTNSLASTNHTAAHSA